MFRAWLLSATGEAIDQREASLGILNVNGEVFESLLLSQVSAWSAGVPVVMCGMIGSRQGWIEAPYVAAPVTLASLIDGVIAVSCRQRDVRIVPGVCVAGDPTPDVMRGEETQVFGAMRRCGIDDGRFVLPGTHSKWVTVARGRLSSFATFMTGEIYHACRAHTILGQLMVDADNSADAFLRGVSEGAAAGSPGCLLNRLFRVRTAGLFGEVKRSELADYLSGMLIGAELGVYGDESAGPLYIIAGNELGAAYATAAAELGFEPVILPTDCAKDGLYAIATAIDVIKSVKER